MANFPAILCSTYPLHITNWASRILQEAAPKALLESMHTTATALPSSMQLVIQEGWLHHLPRAEERPPGSLPESGGDICVFPAPQEPLHFKTAVRSLAMPSARSPCPLAVPCLLPGARARIISLRVCAAKACETRSPVVSHHPLLQQATPQGFAPILVLAASPRRAIPVRGMPNPQRGCLVPSHASPPQAKPL